MAFASFKAWWQFCVIIDKQMTLTNYKAQMSVHAQQPLDWHRTAVFVTCLVITAFSCWALSNGICLHMISSHMMTWDTFGSCLQYCPCCPEKNYVLLAAMPTVVFCCSYGKTTKINVNALGLRPRRSSSKRNNVKLAQDTIRTPKPLNSTHRHVQLSVGARPCRLFIKRKRR